MFVPVCPKHTQDIPASIWHKYQIFSRKSIHTYYCNLLYILYLNGATFHCSSKCMPPSAFVSALWKVLKKMKLIQWSLLWWHFVIPQGKAGFRRDRSTHVRVPITVGLIFKKTRYFPPTLHHDAWYLFACNKKSKVSTFVFVYLCIWQDLWIVMYYGMIIHDRRWKSLTASV